MRLELDRVYASINTNKNTQLHLITLLAFGNIAGYSIPHFCYHRKLMLAGNCRACLCIVENQRKPTPTCATQASNNMHLLLREKAAEIDTLHENVLELMLCNHTLDCPFCDQGGECELQDIVSNFGNIRSGYFFKKHCFENKNCGPVIKTMMNRCIHCTRCVRFAKDIAGFDLWGLTGRGSSMEIGNYINNFFFSEVSGNAIDICPTGALTSKPYSFKSRPWDLSQNFSIDFSDGLGSNISVNTRGTLIYRVIPRINDEVNEDWISDKARFYFDGLLHNRIAFPMNSFNIISWDFALFLLKKNVFKLNASANEFSIFINNNIECESMLIIKKFFNKLGISSFNNFVSINNDFTGNYRFGMNFTNIDTKTHICLTVGCDLRNEASVLNLRYRKKYLNGHCSFYNFGSFLNSNYALYNLSSQLKSFLDFNEGKSNLTTVFLKKTNIFNHIIFNSSFFMNKTFSTYFKNLNFFLKNINKFNILNVIYNKTNTTGSLDLNFYHKFSINQKKIKKVFLINTESSSKLSLFKSNKDFLRNKFTVFIGSIANNLIQYANIVLPNTNIFQRTGTFVNIEGRSQYISSATYVSEYEDIRTDSSIFVALSIFLNLKLNLIVADLPKLLYRYLPSLKFKNKIQSCAFNFLNNLLYNMTVLNHSTFVPVYYSFYQTDDISYNSYCLCNISFTFKSTDSSYLMKNLKIC